MKEVLINWLNKVVKDNITINFGISGIIRTYDDSSGQRLAYLEHYGYGNPQPDKFPEFYIVKRKLAFTNDGDIGKDGAVLFTLNVKDLESKSITVSETKAQFGDIIITAYKNVEI